MKAATAVPTASIGRAPEATSLAYTSRARRPRSVNMSTNPIARPTIANRLTYNACPAAAHLASSQPNPLSIPVFAWHAIKRQIALADARELREGRAQPGAAPVRGKIPSPPRVLKNRGRRGRDGAPPFRGRYAARAKRIPRILVSRPGPASSSGDEVAAPPPVREGADAREVRGRADHRERVARERARGRPVAPRTPNPSRPDRSAQNTAAQGLA